MNILDHLEKLPVLLALSQTGSLRQTAFRLNVSQPAITRSLRILEEACGGELVKRTQKGASLTPRGLSVLALATEIAESVREHTARIEAFDPELDGEIVIGTYESIAVYYWPTILRELQTALPNVEIAMRTGRSEELERALVKGEFDLVVTVAPKPRRGIVSVELFRDHLEIYILKGLTPAAASSIILFQDVVATFDPEIRRVSRRYGLQPKRKVLTDSFEVVRAMTLAGVGLGVMPTRVAAIGSPDGSSRPLLALSGGIMQEKSEHVIAASYHSSRQEHPVISNVLRVVQAKVAAAARGR